MNRTDRLFATGELQCLLAEYWHDVVTNWGRSAPEYYREDDIFEGPRTRAGTRFVISTSGA
jgi:hypothetical protein